MDPQVHASRPPPTNPLPHDVAALTRKLARGDEAAYREFFEYYYARLFRYLCVVANGDEHAAQEALQSTLDRLVRHVRPFDDEAVFWSWLTVLARTAYLDHQRGRRRYFGFLERFRSHAENPETAAPDDADVVLRERLQRGMQSLSPDERQLLDWKYDERAGVEEIAARLGVSPKAAESRLSRVREKLKRTVLNERSHD